MTRWLRGAWNESVLRVAKLEPGERLMEDDVPRYRVLTEVDAVGRHASCRYRLRATLSLRDEGWFVEKVAILG